MDVESLAKQLILQNMTPEQQNAVLDSVRASLQEARNNQKRRVSENVGMVVDALKKIEADIRAKYDDLGGKIEARVNSIRDGRDGADGRDGKDGRNGRDGKDGQPGPMGPAGRDGRDGLDGQDGVSVIDAKIDFDGSLIISLSNGREINVGEVVAADVADKIRVLTYGGGSGGGEGSSGLTYKGTWNASTNTPTLTSSVGTSGDYYIVSTAGTTDLNGITDWQPGDWAIFNGTVWQKIDQSWATAGANSNITSMTGITGGISSPDFIQFDTTAGATPAVGRLLWNNTEGTFEFGMLGGNVNLQLGMENVVRVKNDDTVNLTDGMVVYISGANGANLLVKRAQATSDGLSATTLGVVTEPIATNGQGYITTFGNVNGLDTTAFAAGDVLYLSPTTAGALTNVKPSAPNHMVTVAVCTKVSAGNGQIFVRVDNGYELDELHNVSIVSAASGNTLIYDAVAGVWENANLTDGTGISITEGAGSITIANTGVTSATAGTGISVSASTGAVTITNTAPDQVVSLTGAGTTAVTGTYPNFTITSNDQYTGTVTSVSGTSPINSSGGATPAISLASGYGDTQNPYASKTANYVLAAPNGSAGVPTFRAIVAADIPTLNQNTTGTASNVTGVVAVANGGTGITSFGSGIATWLGTPSSANLASAITDETGSGALVFGTSPTLTTPSINSAQIATVSGTAPLYLARAWVNFNGTGTVAIRASGNVSSITDLGTGIYQVNLSTAISDANYSVCALVGDANKAASNGISTSSFGITSRNSSNTLTDSDTVTAIAIR